VSLAQKAVLENIHSRMRAFQQERQHADISHDILSIPQQRNLLWTSKEGARWIKKLDNARDCKRQYFKR
jgi:hypothetical protein